MIGSVFSFYQPGQVEFLREKVLSLLADYGVKLDPHPEMFRILSQAGIIVEAETGMVRFPRDRMEEFLAQAPRQITLGARGENRKLSVPRQDGTFYTRTVTGAHGYIDPETRAYRKVTVKDLADWAKLINHLDEISFLPFLFASDVPVETADVHGLATLLKNTDKHVWVQPYSAESVEYLIRLGAVAAGGGSALANNPLISMIACSLTPRAFKMMDLEIILQSARAGLPIHACSLPGSGGTAPATLPAVILLASAEILAMLAMAQAVVPGTPVVACPIIFSTDMRSGRSLQSSVEAMKAASGAIQFIKAAFDLPTHNYGSGSDSPVVDGQSVSERSMLGTLMALSGLDILGGAGQLEVATSVSPIQLIMDNEIFGMLRRLKTGFSLDEDQVAWQVLGGTKPGEHFLMSEHTLKHCRDGFIPHDFIKSPRDTWEREGGREVFDRILDRYRRLMAAENQSLAGDDLSREFEGITRAADRSLVG